MLYVVLGPPAAGKSTWVLARATPRDIVVDFDRLALALTGPHADPHEHPSPLWGVTRKARRAAIDAAVAHRDRLDVYVIHSMPSQAKVDDYARLGASFVTLDPGRDVVLERCRAQRPGRMVAVARRWYDEPQAVIPSGPPQLPPEPVRTSRTW